MRRFVFVVLGATLALASCVSRGTADRIEGQRDSLQTVVGAKDSLINAIFEDINSISENLAAIKTRESLLTVNESDIEHRKRPVEEINNDIAAIDRLLQDNRKKIASLQHSAALLRKANLRIDGLEKMIVDLNTQLVTKDDEVAHLKEDLSKMGVEVEALHEQVAEQTAQVETLTSEKSDLENRMSTVCYVVGAQKELIEAAVVEKQGFIGRTLVARANAPAEAFTQADARELHEIAIGHKKVELVTSHPEGSYELVTDADKVVEKLVILDPEQFWGSSKKLIVSYK